MRASANVDPAREGFTLVEMLVVIVIIGILTGLILGAVVRARSAASIAVVKGEIAQMDTALQNYQNEFTELPPDFGHADAVERHLRKAFPRYAPNGDRLGNRATDGRPNGTFYERFANDVYDAYGGTIDPMLFDPASALVFWLGGLPEAVPGAGAQWIPAGFHADPTFPFRQGLPRTKALFDFDAARIAAVESHYSDPNDSTSAPVLRFLRYYPRGVEAPYAYFKSHRASGTWQYQDEVSPGRWFQHAYQHAIVGAPLGNNCVPYRDPQNPPAWRNHDTCQIVSAGLDGQFGNLLPDNGASPNYRFSITAGNFTQGDYDNITNFSERTLEDEIE